LMAVLLYCSGKAQVMTKPIPFILSLILLTACKKEKHEVLPPETQTGAGTFGCLANGKVFIPGGVPGWAGSELSAYYQIVDDRYHFVLGGRRKKDGIDEFVGLFADSLKIVEGGKYILSTRKRGNTSANYSNNSQFFTDGNLYTGELWIKKLDTVKLIVSGTFWFDAVNSKGEKVEIREGRFDMGYRR